MNFHINNYYYFSIAMEEIFNNLEKLTALPCDPFYTNSDYNSLRRLKVLLLSGALHHSPLYRDNHTSVKINYLIQIENSCLNETIRKAKEYDIRCTWGEYQFEQIYHSTCYTILSAIDITSGTGSPMLVEKIFTKKIDLNTIASLSCKELCPEKYEIMAKKIEERANMKEVVKFTELYFCRKCKRNKCKAESVQNRCGDESNTYYITCLFCHNKWFGG